MQTYFQHVFFYFFIYFLFNFIYSVFVLKIGKPRLHQTALSVPPPSAPNSTRKLVEELVPFSFFSWVWQLRSPNDQKAIGGCQLLALRFPWVVIAASACTRYTLHVELMWKLWKVLKNVTWKPTAERGSRARQRQTFLHDCLVIVANVSPSWVSDPLEEPPGLKHLRGTWRFEGPWHPLTNAALFLWVPAFCSSAAFQQLPHQSRTNC